MKKYEVYIDNCLLLAKKGMKKVAPNPMVGCVIVHQNQIIGEGYHQEFGKAHAEVNAIHSIENKELLKESTLFVNLEPCAHFGKTPPCSDLIIEHKIPRVVIGCVDTYTEVSGKGIAKMKAAGIEVVVGVHEHKSRFLNRRFFTFHEKKRPYIILKWAQTQDGFIDVDRSAHSDQNNWITNEYSKKLVHQWRSEEAAIMIGTNTALNDDPQLTVREVEGENPLRIVIDLNLRLPETLHIFDRSTPTLIINYKKQEKIGSLEYVKLNENGDLIKNLLGELYQRNIQSVIVEGGAQLLNTYIKQNLWDEARVFIGEKKFEKGLKAPLIDQEPINSLQFDSDILNTYLND